MRNWRSSRRNRARVLLAIREGKAKHFHELKSLFISDDMPRSFQIRIEMDLGNIVSDLIEAGLLVDPGGLYEGELKVTDQLQLIQSALEISLTDLSRLGVDSISVTPIFRSAISTRFISPSLCADALHG